MIVAGHLGTVQVVVEVVLLVGADADVGHIVVTINIRYKGEPCFASGRSILLGGQPAILHALDESVGEHAGA